MTTAQLLHRHHACQSPEQRWAEVTEDVAPFVGIRDGLAGAEPRTPGPAHQLPELGRAIGPARRLRCARGPRSLVPGPGGVSLHSVVDAASATEHPRGFLGWEAILSWVGMLAVALGLAVSCPASAASAARGEAVSFWNGEIELHGVLYLPDEAGVHPAVLYNHGSAPGMLSQQAFDQIGPRFAGQGWVFFAPWRRGQGLSAEAGPYIGDEIFSARVRGASLSLVVAVPLAGLGYWIMRRRRPWVRGAWGTALVLGAGVATYLGGSQAAAASAARLLETDHLSDQLAALKWLEARDDVDPRRIATAGNSFGGVEAVLGAERFHYCAAVDGSGGAESWGRAPALRAAMLRAVRHAQAPIFFFQAENDYDLAPTRDLGEAMRDAGRAFEAKIYPPYGTSAAEGHSFAWAGSDDWGDDVLAFLEAHCPRDTPEPAP